MYGKVLDEITYPLPNLNCATVDVWISNFFTYFVIDVTLYTEYLQD